jgi:uncharacterized membrane protein (UPF0127 family)
MHYLLKSKHFILTLVISFVALTGCSQSESEPLIIKGTLYSEGNLKTYNVSLEVANTPESRRMGLMNRTKLPKDRGMIFIWPETRIHKMWMKNTYIPLDMIFIKDDTVVGVLENALPHTQTLRYVNTPNNIVIELNAGSIKQQGINKGWRLKASHNLQGY